MASISDNSALFLFSMVWWSYSKAWVMISVAFSLEASICSAILSLASTALVSFEFTSWAHKSASLMASLWTFAILHMSAILWSLWRTRVQSLQVSNWYASQKNFNSSSLWRGCEQKCSVGFIIDGSNLSDSLSNPTI